MTDKLTIDVGGWPTHNGARADLYLDPDYDDGVRVYSFGAGSGTPICAYEGYHIHLATVPADVVPESLAAWLRGESAALLEIAAGYEGDQWDGTRHRGHWTEGARDAAYDFGERLGDAITYNDDISRYWDAADYLVDTRSDVIDAVRAAGGDVDAVVADLLITAADDGIALREDELDSYVTELWDDAQATDDDGDEG